MFNHTWNGWGPIVLLVGCSLLQQAQTDCQAAAIPLIFDTDLESDVDDAGTVAMLHALAARNEVQLLAMGVSVKHRWSAPCLDALNTFYGRPDIPIGRLTGKGIDSGSKYAESIARSYPADLKPDQAPDVVRVYRRALAASEDGSVVLLSVGFLTNVRNLLRSQPDQISALSGRELVRRKVRTWVCMGGKFPQGREWNVHRDASAASMAFESWPGSIVFSGFEIGVEIQTGAGLKRLPETHVLRRCYTLYNGLQNRSSWDQTAALYAVRGLEGNLDDLWDLSPPGRIAVQADGSNSWRAEPQGPHRYLIRKQQPASIAAQLERLMLFQPKSTP